MSDLQLQCLNDKLEMLQKDVRRLEEICRYHLLEKVSNVDLIAMNEHIEKLNNIYKTE